MKINELRYGSRVKDKNGVECTVVSITHGIKSIGLLDKSFKLSMSDINDLVPIELTEEKLVELSFEKIDSDITVYGKGFGKYYDGDFEAAFILSKGSDGKFYISVLGIAVKIFYVHQLQNLYYSLVGEELV